MSVLAAICLFCHPFISTPCLLHMNPIGSGLDPETMLVFCFVFLKTFEEGGRLGHRKSMSLETHLLTITEQAMQVTHIGSECRGSLGNK